jgi:fucose 4-O-acetylase-like acetyltransferase
MTNSCKDQYHNNSIDFLKGILILLVVIGHILPISKEFYIIQYFHMPLFLAIFGYLIKSEELQEINYLVLRLIRLLVPYFTISVLYYFVSHLLYYKDIYDYNTIINFYWIIFVPTISHPHLWFLYSAAIHILLIYFLLNKIEHKKLYYVFIFILCGIVINYFVRNGALFELRRSFGWFIFTLWGFLYSKYNKEHYPTASWNTKKVKYISMFFVYIFLTLLKIKVDFPDYALNNPSLISCILFIVNNLLLITIVLIFIQNASIINISIINWLGKNTMIIYLLHPMFILFAVLVLHINNLLLIFIFSLIPCIPIILLEHKLKILQFLLSGKLDLNYVTKFIIYYKRIKNYINYI